MKRTIAAATAAATAVGGVAVGATLTAGPAALAQAEETEDSQPLAEDLVERATTAIREALSGLVDDGVIDSAQADAVAEELASNRMFEGRRHGRGHGFGFGAASELTELLGIETSELMSQLREGSSLAEIAEAQGVDPDAVAELLVSEAETRLDAAVERGLMDEAEADEKLAELEGMIDDIISGEMSTFGFGRHGFDRGAGDGNGDVTDAA